MGTATTGSSEAIQLGGLAMKRIWQEKRKAAGKSIHEPGPNIVMGANAQVALEKFARYFDVEMRLVPISVESKYRLDPKKAMKYVDENTIGVYVILGSMLVSSFNIVCFSDVHAQARTPGITNLLKKWHVYSMSTRKEPEMTSQSMVRLVILVFDLYSRECDRSGWRIWGLFRSVCFPQVGMGLQNSACCFHQHIWPQVWSLLRWSGLDYLALPKVSPKRPHF